MIPIELNRIRRIALLLLCMTVTLSFRGPLPVHCEDARKTVRVGWYDSSFNTVDQFGRRSGYGYEYQLKIAAYTGWTFEYISGSWSTLLEMLQNGEIPFFILTTGYYYEIHSANNMIVGKMLTPPSKEYLLSILNGKEAE